MEAVRKQQSPKILAPAQQLRILFVRAIASLVGFQHKTKTQIQAVDTHQTRGHKFSTTIMQMVQCFSVHLIILQAQQSTRQTNSVCLTNLMSSKHRQVVGNFCLNIQINHQGDITAGFNLQILPQRLKATQPKARASKQRLLTMFQNTLIGMKITGAALAYQHRVQHSLMALMVTAIGSMQLAHMHLMALAFQVTAQLAAFRNFG